jgi:hypothetical protein
MEMITLLCEDPNDDKVLGDQVNKIAKVLQQRGSRHKKPCD